MGSQRPLLVAIVGGSGSGKTWLADKLAAALGPDAARLSLDDFYRDRSHLSPARREKLNFDHPRAIDWALVEKALRQILAGRPVRLPCYDFPTHCRASRTRRFRPKLIVLMDGLWLLRRPSVRKLFGFSIFLDCSTRVRFRRRLERDLQMRGRTEASIRKQFRETVEPMYVRYVAPQMKFADVVIQGACSERNVLRVLTILQEHRRRPKSKRCFANMHLLGKFGAKGSTNAEVRAALRAQCEKDR